MQEREIECRLKNAIDAQMPDCFEEIMKQTITQSVECPKKEKNVVWKVMPFAACICLLIVLIFLNKE